MLIMGNTPGWWMGASWPTNVSGRDHSPARVRCARAVTVRNTVIKGGFGALLQSLGVGRPRASGYGKAEPHDLAAVGAAFAGDGDAECDDELLDVRKTSARLVPH